MPKHIGESILAGKIIVDEIVVNNLSTLNGTLVNEAVTQNTTNIANHISRSVGAHAATAISILDSGDYFTSIEVEGALQEIGNGLDNNESAIFDLASDFQDHLVQSLGVHAASAISVLDTANYYTAIDTEGVLAELGVIKHTQNTDTGTTAIGFHIQSGAGTHPLIKNDSGSLRIRNAADNDDADLIIRNLTINGTTTTVHSETVAIDDNILLLNSNVVGTPSENGGIQIKRGSSTDASLIWDESVDTWKAGILGSEVQLADINYQGVWKVNGTTNYYLNPVAIGTNANYGTDDKLRVYGGTNGAIANVVQIDGLSGTVGTGKSILFKETTSIGWINHVSGKEAFQVKGQTTSGPDTVLLHVETLGASLGKVGIKNANPQYELDVTGAIRATTDIYANNNLYISSATANRVAIIGATQNLTFSAVTSTELGYLSGVTSGVQGQITGHISNATGAHAASAISVLDTAGLLIATDAENAFAEIANSISVDKADLATHISKTSNVHAASAISILDTTNYYTSTNLEGSLAEIGLALSNVASTSGTTSSIWSLDSDAGTFPRIKNESGVLAIRNTADSAYGNMNVANITLYGDIIPDMTGATGGVSLRNIGDSTHRFSNIWANEVHIGASSLYVNGKKVLEDVSNEMNFSTNVDQSMRFKTTGTGIVYLDSQDKISMQGVGGVQLTVPSTNATKHINVSNASLNGNITFTATGSNAQVQFSATDEIDLTATLLDLNGNADISGSLAIGTTLSVGGASLSSLIGTSTGTTNSIWSLNSGATSYPRLKNDNGSLRIRNAGDDDDASLIVKNLTVNGTTTTVNSETITIADNIITLNSDVTGTPIQDGGIEIKRGTATNASLIWDEANDYWKAGLQGAEVRLLKTGDESLINHNSLLNVHQAVDTTNSPTFLNVTLSSKVQNGGILYTDSLGVFQQSTGLSFDGTNIVASNVRLSSKTQNGGVFYGNSTGVIQQSSALTFDGTKLITTDMGISGILDLKNTHDRSKIRLLSGVNEGIGTEANYITIGAQEEATGSVGTKFYATGSLYSNEIIAQIGTGGAGQATGRLDSYFMGKMAIGKNNPNDALDVKGSIRITATSDDYPVFQLFNYSHNNTGFNFDCYFDTSWKSSYSGSNFRIYKITDKLYFSYASGVAVGSPITNWSSQNASNTVAMLIKNDGMVGIGNITDPTYPLHVGGRIYSVNTAAMTINDNLPNSVYGFSQDNRTFGIRTQTSGNAMLTIDPNGKVGVGGIARGAFEVFASGTTYIAVTDTGRAVDNKTWSWVAANGKFYGQTLNDAFNAASNFMIVDRTVNSVDFVTFPTKIGIGTTVAPNQLVQIHATSGISGLQLTNSNGSGASNGLIMYSGTTSASILNYENTPLTFQTNGLERGRFSAVGNLAIGLTTLVDSWGRLAVSGNVAFVNPTISNCISFTPADASSAHGICSNYLAGGGDRPMVLGTYANRNSQLYLNTDGKVGVGYAGSTDILEALTVNGNINISKKVTMQYNSTEGTLDFIFL